jgi:Uma2 family endonuclease
MAGPTILEQAAAGRATIVPWTVEQYHRAIAAALLPDDVSVELIDGFIVHKDRAAAGEDPMTIGDRHRVVGLRLAQLAPSFEALRHFLQTQQPVSLPPTNEPEPDAAIVRGEIDDYLDRPPGAADVSCVIEVSDSSLALDLGPKLTAYASAGIPQYVVVDLANNRVLNHDMPAGNAYTRVVAVGRDEMLRISAGSGQHVAIAVERLLP